MIAAISRAGARFSITARQDVAVRRAIAGISDDAWTAIRLPARRVRQAVAAVGQLRRGRRGAFTAFASRGKKRAVTARLIMRRVRDQNPEHLVANDQGELFPAWRHYAVFTDSPLMMLQAEADHRRHAIIEQAIAGLKNGPLAHLPSGRFNANGAWLVVAAMASNLTRAAGALASLSHARATTATIRRQLINVPARAVRSADASTCDYRQTGPGPTPGSTCSPPRQARRSPPPSDLRAANPNQGSNGEAGPTGRPTLPATRTPVAKINYRDRHSRRCIRVSSGAEGTRTPSTAATFLALFASKPKSVCCAPNFGNDGRGLIATGGDGSLARVRLSVDLGPVCVVL